MREKNTQKYFVRNKKAAEDAEKYLKQLYKKQKEIAKEREEKVRDLTYSERFINSRRELIEIERSENESQLKSRQDEYRIKEYYKLKNINSKFSIDSGYRLKIDELSEKISSQLKEIEENEKKIEKIEKSKSRTFAQDFLQPKIKKLEKKLESAKNELGLLLHSESLALHPDSLAEFLSSTNKYAEPAILTSSVNDAWAYGHSQVRDVIIENNKQIKDVEEKIEKTKELITGPIEEDIEFQAHVNTLLTAEREKIDKKYQKIMQNTLNSVSKLL